jgi:hypothetical protein
MDLTSNSTLDPVSEQQREGHVRDRDPRAQQARHRGSLRGPWHPCPQTERRRRPGVRPAQRARPTAGAEAQPGLIRRRKVGQAGSRPSLEPARGDLPHGADHGDVLQRRQSRVRDRQRALQVVLSHCADRASLESGASTRAVCTTSPAVAVDAGRSSRDQPRTRAIARCGVISAGRPASRRRVPNDRFQHSRLVAADVR